MIQSKIEWTDYTFNPVIGCSKVSQACKFCYAETFANRYHQGKGLWSGNLYVTKEGNWKKVEALNRKAEREGVRYKVFCGSLCDLWQDHPTWIEPRKRLIQLVLNTKYLDWQFLTKRPENIVRLMPDFYYKHPDHGKNIWLGATTENQEELDKRLLTLQAAAACISAQHCFLSIEPMLSPIMFPDHTFSDIHTDAGFVTTIHPVDWIIVGGESGALNSIRDFHIGNAVGMIARSHCPVFVKQLGTVVAHHYNLNHKKGGDPNEWHKVNKELPNKFKQEFPNELTFKFDS